MRKYIADNWHISEQLPDGTHRYLAEARFSHGAERIVAELNVLAAQIPETPQAVGDTSGRGGLEGLNKGRNDD